MKRTRVLNVQLLQGWSKRGNRRKRLKFRVYLVEGIEVQHRMFTRHDGRVEPAIPLVGTKGQVFLAGATDAYVGLGFGQKDSSGAVGAIEADQLDEHCTIAHASSVVDTTTRTPTDMGRAIRD